MYHFLCQKCSNIPNIYYSQKEWKYVGMEIIVVYGMGY